MRGATLLSSLHLPSSYISIHAPLAGRDPKPLLGGGSLSISIHAPLAGRDGRSLGLDSELVEISIHAPLAGRDISHLCVFVKHFDFNPRAPCGARLAGGGAYQTNPYAISIHAPLAGRDCACYCGGLVVRDFNPRAPCGARRISARTAAHRDSNFNPRAPCGARQPRLTRFCRAFRISIHAPLAGRDALPTGEPMLRRRFQSTRPLRGATASAAAILSAIANFNPRAPCGARRGRGRKDRSQGGNFNPRAPCGARREPSLPEHRYLTHISIHAPLAGRDFC